MSLSRTISAMSDDRRIALRRNYEQTKLERDALAKAYEASGSGVAGNINLQQFEWKLERLKGELIAAGEIIDGIGQDQAAGRGGQPPDQRKPAQAAADAHQRPILGLRSARHRQSEN